MTGPRTEPTTRSGIPLKTSYEAVDVSDRMLERPGEYPFTRGRLTRPGAAAGGWIHRELSGEGGPAQSNRQLHYLLEHGQAGLDVIGDGPTQSMLDADHPLCRHSVGTQGVSLCRLSDYAELFAGIPLDQVSISSSVPAAFALTGLIHAAEQAEMPLGRLRGSVLQPPLYANDAAYDSFMPISLASRLSVDTIAFCAEHLPKFHSYVEDTYFFSEGGLSAIEELALGFVQIRHLVGQTLARGIPIDSFASRIALLVNCSMDFFEEIAKIRAARRLFATMMRTDYGATDPRSLSLNVTSHTSGLTLTAEQPINNVVRGTVQGLALALAGVQAMEISAFDEGFRTPSPEAHVVGLRTQQIIEKESGVTRSSDPLGGSHLVESLTDEIESRVLAMVHEIESLGDPIELAERGHFRQIFTNAAVRYQHQVESGELQIVGKNCYRMSDEDDRLLRDIAETKIEPDRDRIAEIAAFRKSRSNDDVVRQLRVVLASVGDPEANLIPAVLDAGNAGATMGEIAGAMRQAHGHPFDPLGYLKSPL